MEQTERALSLFRWKLGRYDVDTQTDYSGKENAESCSGAEELSPLSRAFVRRREGGCEGTIGFAGIDSTISYVDKQGSSALGRRNMVVPLVPLRTWLYARRTIFLGLNSPAPYPFCTGRHGSTTKIVLES